MKYSVRAITFGINCGNTFGITFSAAKVLLFFDIHKFMSKKSYTFFPFVFHRVTVVLSTMVSLRKNAKKNNHRLNDGPAIVLLFASAF